MKKEKEGGNANTLQQNNRKVERLNERGKNEMWGGMRVAEPKIEFCIWLIDISALRCGV